VPAYESGCDCHPYAFRLPQESYHLEEKEKCGELDGDEALKQANRCVLKSEAQLRTPAPKHASLR
jgi:hypothetical protein